MRPTLRTIALALPLLALAAPAPARGQGAAPTVTVPLQTRSIFNRVRGLVGDAPYLLQASAEDARWVRVVWKVDELESDNPGDQGDQTLSFAARGTTGFEYPARRTRREPRRSEDGVVFAVEEEYESLVPAADFRRLVQLPQVEMKIRGKSFVLAAKELPQLARLAAALPDAPAAAPAPAPAASTVDVRLGLSLVESAPRPAPALPKRTLSDPLAAPVWWTRDVRDEGGARFLIAGHTGPRPPEGSEEEPKPFAPFLAVGDSLSVFARGKLATRVPVIARAWGGPGENAYCGVLLDPVGWAYFATPLAALHRGEEDPSFATVALPVPFRDAQELAPPSAAAVAALAPLVRRDYLAARDSLEKVIAEWLRQGAPEDVGAGEAETPAELRERLRHHAVGWDGPGGRLTFVSASMMDDPSDHGGESYVTYLVRENGTVVDRRAGRYTPVYAADLDGDGVRELILEEGVVHLRAGKWVFPEPSGSYYCD